MSMTLNERNPNVNVLGAVGDLGTTTTLILPGLYCRKRARIKNVWLVDMTGIAKNATHHVQITVTDNAGSPVTYASVDTADNAAVAKTPLALVLSENDSDSSQAVSQERDVPAGTMLLVKAQTFGTAVLTKAAVLIEWYPA